MKKNIFLLAIFSFSLSVFALPGVKSFLPDMSGQYVYYRDSTFERESYTGFLYYDEGTYAIRYFAPMVSDKKKPLAEKDIRILFTIDASQDHVELTGERIISTVTPDDTDIINYIHDILYELTSRRQKVTYFTDKTAVRQDYEQFGGKVTMIFDALIPIFNLKSISTVDGKPAFSLVTAGQLSSSEDNTFFDFKGMPLTLVDKHHAFKQKKAEAANFTYQTENGINQQIELDSQWKQSMDNLWLLGNSAILAMDVIPAPKESAENRLSLLIRRMMLGTENSYPVLAWLSITNENNKTTISNLHYKPSTESVTQDFKILTTLKNGSIAFFTLTVFNEAYTKNKAYFQKILNSYRIDE